MRRRENRERESERKGITGGRKEGEGGLQED